MLKSTNQPLSEAYSLALLDLDGVVYRGKNPVEHAAKNIRKAESLGMTVEYTTNNSSRLPGRGGRPAEGVRFGCRILAGHHLVGCRRDAW